MTSPSKRNAVLEVNGEPIFADEIRARVSEVRERAEAAGRELSVEERFELRPAAIEHLIGLLLMRQEARRLKLQPAEAEIEAALAGATESRENVSVRLMVDMLLARWVANVRPPKIAEVRDFYQKNRDTFWAPELIAASHIVKDTPEALEEIRAAILTGADLAETAKSLSDCPENGGDLGYFPRGVMVPEFDEVAFAAPIGQLTAPFRTRFGWHAVLVRDRRPAGIRTFEESAPIIQQRLLREKQNRAAGEQLNALRNQARIVELARP